MATWFLFGKLFVVVTLVGFGEKRCRKNLPLGDLSFPMIDAKSAIAIADEHIAAQPVPLEGYRMVRYDPQDCEAGWFFPYGIECDLDIPESEREMFGGASGFLVHRSDGDIEVLAFGQLSDFGLS